MKELTQYQCEICGTLYADATHCQECEDAHVEVSSLYGYRYVPVNQGPNSKYPVSITVQMRDGSLIVYKR